MRRVFLGLMVGWAALAGSATVLPEMDKHLAFGNECARRGYDTGALASASLILLDQVRIYVDARNSTAATRDALSDAEFIWEDALDSETKFVRVGSAKEAEVVISFTPGLRVGGREAGGFTEWSRSVQWIDGDYVGALRAEMKLRTIRPDGKPLTREQARQAALHEIGHLLGLDDSKVSGEVMSPLNLSRPIGTPAMAEVNALKTLRAKAQSVRMTALAARIQ